MTVTNQNYDVYRGDDALLQVTLTDANGDPFVLSANGTIKYRISYSQYAEEADALVRKELSAGILMQDDVAEITLDEDDTDLPPGDYYHEMKVYDGDDTATAMTGTFTMRPSLTMTQQMQAQNASLAGEVILAADASIV